MVRRSSLRLAAVIAVATSSLVFGACVIGGAITNANGQQQVANVGCANASTSVITVTSRTKVQHLGPGSYEIFLTVDKLQRCILLYVPPTAVKNRPLILVYHGALDTAASTAASTDFEQEAQDKGQVVAFLQGFADTWNDGAGATDAERAHVNDVDYSIVAISDLKRLVSFDAKRIVAAGFSNGALMVEYLGCKIAGQLALIVPVEGQLPVNVSQICKPTRPIDVYEVHGTDDRAIPYGGGKFIGVDGAIITVLSAPASVERWATLDKCDPSPLVTYPTTDIVLSTYGYCKDGALAVLRTIVYGGHQWGANIAQLVAPQIPTS